MVLPHGSGDLYHKYRPRRFNEVAGHKEVITSIKKAVTAGSPSQAFLLIGDSGTGKTTTARIMALSLNCDNTDKSGEPCLECKSCKAILSSRCSDIIEVNAADHRGIGDIRSLCRTMPLMPLQLRRKVFILDEAHQLTNDAQSSLLKELEEAPAHVFIILCSTHPKKILPTVKNRCQRFKFNSLRPKEMQQLLEEVSTLEGELFSPQIYKALTGASGGSPRQGLVLLQQVMQLGSRELSDVLKLLESDEQGDPDVIKICFQLGGNPSWITITNTLESCRHIGAAAIGMIVAGYFRNKLLKAKNQAEAVRFAKVLELFVVPFAEGKLGENQLTLNLYKAHAAMKGVKDAIARHR